MVSSDAKSWAEKFAAELVADGEHIPFERVLFRHLDTITRLRQSAGHTWPGIASMLVRAGARRPDGGLISADQIRVSYSRLIRQVEIAGQQQQSSHATVARSGSKKSVAKVTPRKAVQSPQSARAKSSPARPTILRSQNHIDLDEDISSDDIQSALDRLDKLNKH